MAVGDRETYRRTWEDRLRGFDKDFNAWSSSRGANNNNIRDLQARRRDLDTRTSQMVDIAKNQWEGASRGTAKVPWTSWSRTIREASSTIQAVWLSRNYGNKKFRGDVTCITGRRVGR
jgi:hypothetical protein